jgi:hypothetical protein
MNKTENKAKISAETVLILIQDLYEVNLFLNGSVLGKELSREQKNLLVKDFGYDGTDIDSTREALREYAESMALSVQVRSSWETPGSELEPTEYNVLISWGGPSVRIIGNLNRYTEPMDACLEYQDWHTPWDYYIHNTDELIWFASQFYFG